MDKIKSIFRPGGDQDDKVLYGSSSSREEAAKPTAGPGENYDGSASNEPATLQTDPGQKDRGVTRQILNPGGDKYDETRYGTTAHSDKPLNTATTGTESHAASNAPQIEPLPASEDNHGMLRQVLNPGGDKYDEQRYGTTGQTIAGTPVSRLPTQDDDAMSAMSIKSGVRGPYSHEADSTMAGSEPDTGASTAGATSGHALPDMSAYGASSSQDPTSQSGSAYNERSFPLSGGVHDNSTTDSARYGADEAVRSDPSTADQSHFGRDAALGGAGTAAAGGLAYEAGSRDPLHDSTSEPSSTMGRAPIESSHDYADPSMALGDQHAAQVSSPGPEGPLSGAASEIQGDPFGYHKPDEQPVEGYVHHTHGPHSTDIANVLDPHVPGEFPGEDGEDRHKHTSDLGRDAAVGGAGLGAAGLGAAGYEASQPRSEPSAMSGADPSTSSTGGEGYPISTTTNTMPSSRQDILEEQPEHHYGRDAALAGGAGAAGVGAYELGKDHEPSAMSSADPTAASTSAARDEGYAYPSTESRMQSAPAAAQRDLSQQQPEHHYGRDAALAGGAGAAGVGGYEALKDRDDTGPASKTIGPHDSNTANVLDPRVQPEPEKMKQSTSSAPYESTSGKADPRVNPEKTTQRDTPVYQPPQEKEEDKHHYGRDAAIAGGAGAAGVGAYEASRPSEEVRPTRQELVDSMQHDKYGNDGKLHKSEHQQEKHEKDLEKAREKEAAHGGDRGHEKKEGFLHKILHPGHKDKHADEQSPRASADHSGYPRPEPTEPHSGRIGTDGAIGDRSNVSGISESGAGGQGGAQDEFVTEPHTGLPMNVGKYGYGEGGTDGARQIHGFQGEEGQGPDWEKIKKANTPY